MDFWATHGSRWQSQLTSFSGRFQVVFRSFSGRFQVEKLSGEAIAHQLHRLGRKAEREVRSLRHLFLELPVIKENGSRKMQTL